MVRIAPPGETEWLPVDPGRDPVTLTACVPLGINTAWLLVTGYRLEPAPK